MKYILILSIILIGCGTTTSMSPPPPKECDRFYDTEEMNQACVKRTEGGSMTKDCVKLLSEAYKKCHELTGYKFVEDDIVEFVNITNLKELFELKFGDFSKHPKDIRTPPDTEDKETPADKKQ